MWAFLALLACVLAGVHAIGAPPGIDSICRRYPDNSACACLAKAGHYRNDVDSDEAVVACTCTNPASYVDALFSIPEIAHAIERNSYLKSLEIHCTGHYDPSLDTNFAMQAGDIAVPRYEKYNIARTINYVNDNQLCTYPRLTPLCQTSTAGMHLEIVPYQGFVCSRTNRVGNRDYMVALLEKKTKSRLDTTFFNQNCDMLCAAAL